ncbi:MAG: hypothetical protein Q8S73_14670 [Deltaproteobacteria bacterium]|nr:hypothetical protein [Myxococcales bacterium]MDP3215348.1 hypothetical protein [Deltaproteobacteria bacterium]
MRDHFAAFAERMQECDRVLPAVPYRQWVLSLPWELRLSAARAGAQRRPGGLAFERRLSLGSLGMVTGGGAPEGLDCG